MPLPFVFTVKLPSTTRQSISTLLSLPPPALYHAALHLSPTRAGATTAAAPPQQQRSAGASAAARQGANRSARHGGAAAAACRPAERAAREQRELAAGGNGAGSVAATAATSWESMGAELVACGAGGGELGEHDGRSSRPACRGSLAATSRVNQMELQSFTHADTRVGHRAACRPRAGRGTFALCRPRGSPAFCSACPELPVRRGREHFSSVGRRHRSGSMQRQSVNRSVASGQAYYCRGCMDRGTK